MTHRREDTDGGGGGGGGGYHRVQAARDLESNWEVDLAKMLEDYLLKICSGGIIDESEGHNPVNFAEAALLLQGSAEVYSRKVEYLYSLVLRAWESLSRQEEEQLEGTSDKSQDNAGSKDKARKEDDSFWNLDDIPVEANICLEDTQTNEHSNLNNFVKPPANLFELEDDYLDCGSDAGELESCLLATRDPYRGFILLDPSDKVAVQDYLDVDKIGRGQSSSLKGSFQSPNARSGGASHSSAVKKGQYANVVRSPPLVDSNIGHDPPPGPSMVNDGGFGVDDMNFEPDDHDDEEDYDDDDDDPWKPLNPHEPGNLKVQPFRKVKASKWKGFAVGKHVSISSLFPLARFHGPMSPELREIWKMENPDHATRTRRRESLSLYEKLREQLVNDSSQGFDAFRSPEDDIEEEDETPDLDDDIPEFMDEDAPFHNEEHNGDGAHFGVDDPLGNEDANSQANLEDLCRSHLDALLASIAETEKQSEMAARITTWRQKIEKNLDDEDSQPEFDIHRYGEKILDKLSLDGDDSKVLLFTDVVEGEEKNDVARSFSALLQLVNDGAVELDRNGVDGSVCFTAANPFRVRLLRNEKRKEARVKSPKGKGVRKVGVKCTPEGKKRKKVLDNFL